MRIFVAVEITDGMVISSIRSLQSGLGGGMAVRPENLHFTLQFLGEASEEALEKVAGAISEVEFSDFDVKLKGVGTFPWNRSPRVVWIGAGADKMIELGRKVREAFSPLGFAPDREFWPHITVFRVKSKTTGMSRVLDENRDADFGVQRVDCIKLKKSELTSDGPVYSDLVEVRA